MPTLRIALLAALLIGGACVPAEESNDRILRYDPEKTIMGQIQERDVLRVGLPQGDETNAPPGYCPFAMPSGGGSPRGFLVDMAELIADSLGVEAEYRFASSVELLGMIHVTEEEPEAELDIAFPLVPITESLIQRRTMSDPYWISHSRQLVDGDGSVIDEGPDVWLLRLACTAGGHITGPASSTAGYGAAVPTGTVTFGTLVSQVINEADAEGDWSRFYTHWMARHFEEPGSEDVPIMTVEDAAALWPIGLGSPPVEGSATPWYTLVKEKK